MAILSIQSQLVTGYVGNSAAVFALQRLGREVWPIPTVLLSHHPAHGGAEGGPVPMSLQLSLLDGLARRNSFSRCDVVLSGYLGDARAADTVRAAVAQAKAGMQSAIYLCDPVLGDDGRLYVSHEIIAEMHDLVAKADIVTPNAFELGLLTERALQTRADALAAVRLLQSSGPGIVLLTSFAGTDTPPGTLDVFAVDGAAAWRLNVPGFSEKFYGAGDLFAAIFLDAWLVQRDTPAALGKACFVLQAVLGRTADQRADELLIIETQDLLTASPPPDFFVPTRIVQP